MEVRTYNQGWFVGYRRGLEAIIHMLNTGADLDPEAIMERVRALHHKVSEDERDAK